MGDRYTVGGAQAAKVPALHAAGKALADRGAGDVDELPDHEMVSLDFSADRDQRVRRDTEFRDFPLGFDLGHGELSAFGLRHVDGLAATRAKLQRDVAILLGCAVAEHLAIAELQHGHWNMFAGLSKDPR